MPIVIPRTGAVSVPEISQQDRNKLWEQIVRSYAEAHPEIFAAAKQEEDPQTTEKAV